MLFIAVLFFFLVYLAISIVVVALTSKWAKHHNRSPWRWGWVAALGMYLLMFWDYFPSLAAHNYYCSREAGFWIYITTEQWEKENPDGMATINWYLENGYFVGERKKLVDSRKGFWLSNRFFNVIERQDVFIGEVTRVEEVVLDVQTNRPLARAVDFVRGDSIAALSLGNWKSVSSLMLGLGNRNCNGFEGATTDSLRGFRNQLVKMGGG